jgi:AcrR family transcriptional regulator
MGRPREHDERTRQALLDAAEELLAAGGEAALSVRVVADRVGVSTRAVYSLFGSKEGLLFALAEHGFRLLGERLEGLPVSSEPAADVVAAGALGFRRWALRHPSLFRLAFDRLVVDSAEGRRVSAAGRAALDRLRTRVKRAHDAGLLGTRDVDEVTVQVHALCEGLAIVEGRGRMLPRRAMERAWHEALEALLRGLRA